MELAFTGFGIASVFILLGGLLVLVGYVLGLVKAWSGGCLTGGAGCAFGLPFILIYLLIKGGDDDSKLPLKLLGAGILCYFISFPLIPSRAMIGVFNELDRTVVIEMDGTEEKVFAGDYKPLKRKGTTLIAKTTDGDVIEEVSLPDSDCLYNVKKRGRFFLADYTGLYGEGAKLKDIKLKSLKKKNLIELPWPRTLLGPEEKLPDNVPLGRPILRLEELPSDQKSMRKYAEGRVKKEFGL